MEKNRLMSLCSVAAISLTFSVANGMYETCNFFRTCFLIFPKGPSWSSQSSAGHPGTSGRSQPPVLCQTPVAWARRAALRVSPLRAPQRGHTSLHPRWKPRQLFIVPSAASGNRVLSRSPQETVQETHAWGLWHGHVRRLLGFQCPTSICPSMEKSRLIFTRPRGRASVQTFCILPRVLQSSLITLRLA